jgi:uncharacterized OsmC-like protein
MSEIKSKMTFQVRASRLDAHGSEVNCKQASLIADTDLGGRSDAFNPAELLMAALSACIIKSIERVTPILKFQLRSVEIELNGVRQDVPPKMESINYQIWIDTDETEHRLELLHDNIRKYGTVFNTLVSGTQLSGELLRK